MYERSIYGRCRMVVVATAKGLGAMGGDVTSPEIPVYFVVNVSSTVLFPAHGLNADGRAAQPGGEGALNPPPPFEHTVQSLREEDLGVRICASSVDRSRTNVGLVVSRTGFRSPPSTSWCVYNSREPASLTHAFLSH